MITAAAWARLRQMLRDHYTPEQVVSELTRSVASTPSVTQNPNGCSAKHQGNRCTGPADHAGPWHTAHNGRVPVSWINEGQVA